MISSLSTNVQVPISVAPLPCLSLHCKESFFQNGAEQVSDPYLRGLHSSTLPPVLSRVVQPELTARMRHRLVDWLMEVTCELCLKRETFHLSVNLMDRYLARQAVSRGVFQLLGLATLLISAKIEERRLPSLSVFAQLAANAYTVDELCAMEKKVLVALNWRTKLSTASAWMNYLTMAWDNLNTSLKYRTANQTAYVQYREMYQVLDLAMLHEKCVDYKNSAVAGALFYLITREKSTGPKLWQFINEVMGSFEEIAPAIEFISHFMDFKPAIGLPPMCKVMSKQDIKERYEEVLEFQAYSTKNLEFMNSIL